MKIKGLTAIVTGGSSGMGAETAQHLARAGARVALLDIDIDQATTLADDIGGCAIACDVTDETSAAQAINTICDTYDTPRILINCAGIAPGARIVGKESPHDLALFNKVIQVNLMGTFNMLRLTAEKMAMAEELNDTGERGVIINTASIAAFEGQIGQAAYAASKGGIVSMTLPAARELATFGIRVVTIAPGLIGTPMLLNMPEKVQESLTESTLFPKRLGTPAEFSRLALHIIDNPLINGETIRLDGGVRLAAK